MKRRIYLDIEPGLHERIKSESEKRGIAMKSIIESVLWRWYLKMEHQRQQRGEEKCSSQEPL